MRIATMPMVTVIGSAVVICLFVVLLVLIRRSWLAKHPERVEAEGCPVYGQYYFPGEDNRIEDTTEIEDINPDYESTEGV